MWCSTDSIYLLFISLPTHNDGRVWNSLKTYVIPPLYPTIFHHQDQNRSHFISCRIRPLTMEGRNKENRYPRWQWKGSNTEREYVLYIRCMNYEVYMVTSGFVWTLVNARYMPVLSHRGKLDKVWICEVKVRSYYMNPLYCTPLLPCLNGLEPTPVEAIVLSKEPRELQPYFLQVSAIPTVIRLHHLRRKQSLSIMRIYCCWSL